MVSIPEESRDANTHLITGFATSGGKIVPAHAGNAPLAFHVGCSAVPIKHGIGAGPVNAETVQLDGLRPLLPRKRIVSLLLYLLQVWREVRGTER